MSSWPALFAAALAIWFVLKGPAAKTPSWVQKACRIALATSDPPCGSVTPNDAIVSPRQECVVPTLPTAHASVTIVEDDHGCVVEVTVNNGQSGAR